jgi:hypothetical protein
LSHDKWENPWSSLFTNSLNIIGCCLLEINEDVNVVANDVLVNNFEINQMNKKYEIKLIKHYNQSF